MSARFYKIFAVVLAAHMLVLSLVWVGFSAPYPKPPAAFIYEGALTAEDTGSVKEEQWQHEASDQIDVDHLQRADPNQWIKLREPEKNVLLGF